MADKLHIFQRVSWNEKKTMIGGRRGDYKRKNIIFSGSYIFFKSLFFPFFIMSHEFFFFVEWFDLPASLVVYNSQCYCIPPPLLQSSRSPFHLVLFLPFCLHFHCCCKKDYLFFSSLLHTSLHSTA